MRLTDEELREPDVILIMSHAQFDALPRDIAETLRAFIGQRGEKTIQYRVPAYLYRQMENSAGKGNNDRL